MEYHILNGSTHIDPNQNPQLPSNYTRHSVFQFGGSEAIITALGDEYPIIKKHREIFVGILFTFYFCVGLGSVTQVGILYIFIVFDLLVE